MKQKKTKYTPESLNRPISEVEAIDKYASKYAIGSAEQFFCAQGFKAGIKWKTDITNERGLFTLDKVKMIAKHFHERDENELNENHKPYDIKNHFEEIWNTDVRTWKRDGRPKNDKNKNKEDPNEKK